MQFDICVAHHLLRHRSNIPKMRLQKNFGNLTVYALSCCGAFCSYLACGQKGLERHKQLVTMARRTFWNKPVPLPPAPPHVAVGTAAMINGDTSVCGWLLMKGPHDRELQRYVVTVFIRERVCKRSCFIIPYCVCVFSSVCNFSSVCE